MQKISNAKDTKCKRYQKQNITKSKHNNSKTYQCQKMRITKTNNTKKYQSRKISMPKLIIKQNNTECLQLITNILNSNWRFSQNILTHKFFEKEYWTYDEHRHTKKCRNSKRILYFKYGLIYDPTSWETSIGNLWYWSRKCLWTINWKKIINSKQKISQKM